MYKVNFSVDLSKNVNFIVDPRFTTEEAIDLIHLVMDREYLNSIIMSEVPEIA